MSASFDRAFVAGGVSAWPVERDPEHGVGLLDAGSEQHVDRDNCP